jgi:putative DNA primase/helicase
MIAAELGRTRSALFFLSADMPRDDWVEIAMAVKAELGEGGFELFDEWSRQSDRYVARDTRDTWKSCKSNGGISGATLFFQAKSIGWRDDGAYQKPTAEEIGERRRIAAERAAKEEARDHAGAASKAREAWKAAQPAPGDHPYLIHKRITAHGTRLYRGNIRIGEVPQSGCLIVPMRDAGCTLHSLQFIAGDGTKRFLPAGRVQECYFSIGCPNGTICICEGFASGASIRQATRHAVAVAFSAGNLKSVALALRMKFPKAKIILCADNDRFTVGNPGATKAREAALAIHGYLAVPRFDDIGPYDYWRQGGDANG